MDSEDSKFKVDVVCFFALSKACHLCCVVCFVIAWVRRVRVCTQPLTQNIENDESFLDTLMRTRASR